MCAGVVSVMCTLGFRAVWAMGERVGYGKTKFSFRGAAAVAIDPARDGIIHKFFHTADVRAVGIPVGLIR